MHGIPRRAIIPVFLLLIVCGIVVWMRPSLRLPTGSHPESTIPVQPAALTSALSDPARRRQKTTHASEVPAAHTDPAEEARQAQCAKERRRQWLAYRDQLAMEEDSPDKAITHAFVTQLLSFVSPDPDPRAVAQEFRMARERWPQNLELAWFSMQYCAEELGCDWSAEWRHLHGLDPDNAVVWMLAMQSAMQRKDEVGYEQALQRAASTRGYDPRHGVTFVHVRRVLSSDVMPASCQDPGTIAELQKTLGRPPQPIDWANVHANAMEFALSTPALGALSGCNPDARPLSPSRWRDCQTLLSRLAQGETLLEQQLAMSLLVRLVGNGPGHAQLRERYRQLRWLLSVMRRLELPGDYPTRMWTDGEVAMLQSLAMAQGLWPPPPRWLPADARSRALIQTGRVLPEQRSSVPRPSPQA